MQLTAEENRQEVKGYVTVLHNKCYIITLILKDVTAHDQMILAV